MSTFRDYGWLLLGALAGLASAAFILSGAPTGSRSVSYAPSWTSIAVGILVFAGFAALHFRYQLVRALERHRDQIERGAAASRLIHSATADGRRWLRVVQENLELVSDGSQSEREERLYLEGARANADKIEQAFERIEGNQAVLDRDMGSDRQ